jgi:hypothetical protein
MGANANVVSGAGSVAGDIFLSAFDMVTGNTYIRNLSTDSIGHSTNSLAIGTAPLNYNLGADNIWTSNFAADAATSQVKYNIAGTKTITIDSSGNSVNAPGYSKPGGFVATAPNVGNVTQDNYGGNIDINGTSSTIQTYIQSINQAGLSTANSALVVGLSGNGGYNAGLWGDTMGGAGNIYGTTATIGFNPVHLFFVTNPDSSGNTPPIGTDLGVWQLNANNHLTFNIQAVPEPEEWAMLIAGIPLVGWQVRRKQTKIAQTIA